MATALNNITRTGHQQIRSEDFLLESTGAETNSVRQAKEPGRPFRAYDWSARVLDGEFTGLLTFIQDVGYWKAHPFVGLGEIEPLAVTVDHGSFQATIRKPSDIDVSMRLVAHHGLELARYFLGFDGSLVASVDVSGNMRVRGSVTQSAAFSATTQSAAIARSGGYLYLAYGASAPFSQFARFDLAGNFEINGTITELSGHSFTTGDGQRLSTDATEFRIVPDRITGAFEWVNGTTTLHLAGTLSADTDPNA